MYCFFSKRIRLLTETDKNMMNNEESTHSDENEIYDSMSSSSENSNNNMDASFLHYEIDKDNYSEYLNKLAEKELIRYDYFEVALSEIRIMHIKEIKEILVQAKRKLSKNMFKTKYFLREITRMVMKHSENLEELLERYNVNYKSFFLDETEAKKANAYFRKNINERNAEHNQMIIMNYWLKLDIELDYQLDNQITIKYEWANPAFEPNL
jgi:hypothetical protein